MKIQVSLVVLALVLMSCHGDRLSDSEPGSLGSSGSFSDDAGLDDTDASLPSAVRLRHRLISTSRDGDEADIAISYFINSYVSASLKKGAELRFDLVNNDGTSAHLRTVPVSSEQSDGEVELTIPLSDNAQHITARLSGLSGEVATTVNPIGTILLPDIIELKDSNLEDFSNMHVELVKDSYDSIVDGNRRIHRFAVTVTGNYNPTGTPEYITGLEKHVADHFEIVEGNTTEGEGFVDVESPVTVSREDERIAVYFVLDASGSVVAGQTAHYLQDAVTRMAISLARVADFDFRIFAEDVRYLNSLRELHFDAGESSGTAFFYAMDTALDDIDLRGPAARDSILIAVTDGIDRSSLNYYYPTYTDHQQVREYVAQRVNNIRTAQTDFYNRNLVGHVISLGINETDANIDFAALDEFARSSNMKHTFMDRLSDTDIQTKFERMTRSIRGVYYLEYSSQQIPGTEPLTLKYRLGDDENLDTTVRELPIKPHTR